MKTRHDKTNAVGRLVESAFSYMEKENGGAHCKIIKISPVKQLISFVNHNSNTLAKLVVMPNLQRKRGKDMNFQQISTEVMNVTCKHDFAF